VRRARIWLAAALLCACSAQAAETAEDWIARLNGAMHGLEYRGVIVYVRGAQVQAIEVQREITARGSVDRLRTLTGEPREVISDAGSVRATLGVNQFKLGAIGGWGVPPGEADLAGLAESYQLSVNGGARVADRAAVVIDAVPRDRLRFGYRLWIDAESGLLLGSALMSEYGQVLEQSMFTQLSVASRTASGERPASLPSAAPSADPAWRVTELPPGFRLRATRELDNGRSQLVYSDGLASVSIYVGDGQAGLDGGAQRATVRAFGVDQGGFHAVAVGELPQATLERIARSVARVTDPP